MNRDTGRIAPWRQANWDARAAANFIGGGSGTGLLIAAAVASAAGAPYRPLALVALALVAIGLGCVWLEIGRPWRALQRVPASADVVDDARGDRRGAALRRRSRGGLAGRRGRTGG